MGKAESVVVVLRRSSLEIAKKPLTYLMEVALKVHFLDVGTNAQKIWLSKRAGVCMFASVCVCVVQINFSK